MTCHALVLGADGFIGRHHCLGPRDAGWRAAASAHRSSRRGYRMWSGLGWPAVAARVAVFWPMVSKPALW